MRCSFLTNSLRDPRVKVGVAVTISTLGIAAVWSILKTRAQAASFDVTSWNMMNHHFSDISVTDWYDHIPIDLMTWSNRKEALLERIQQLSSSDILCLQEVDPELFDTLCDRLRPLGFDGVYLQKLGNRPDGLATFFRTRDIQLLNYDVLYYAQSSADGTNWRPAQIFELEILGRRYGVVNTHLAWDQAGELAHAELQQLLNEAVFSRAQLDHWIICGDFNVTPDSAAADLLRESGFIQTHAAQSETPTCLLKQVQHHVDYIWAKGVQTQAHPIPEVPSGFLPTPGHPSDHLALTATLSAA